MGHSLPLLEVRVSLPDLDPLVQCAAALNNKHDDIPYTPLAVSLYKTDLSTCSLSLPMEEGPAYHSSRIQDRKAWPGMGKPATVLP